jgi:hypothetical protein
MQNVPETSVDQQVTALAALSVAVSFTVLQDLGTWWHYVRWTWLLDTNHSPQEVVDALRPHVLTDQGDRVLASPLVRPYQGLLGKGEWKWIREHLSVQKQPRKTNSIAPNVSACHES